MTTKVDVSEAAQIEERLKSLKMAHDSSIKGDMAVLSSSENKQKQSSVYETVKDNQEQKSKSESNQREEAKLSKLVQEILTPQINQNSEEKLQKFKILQGIKEQIINSENGEICSEEFPKSETGNNVQEGSPKSPISVFVPMKGVPDEVIFNVPNRYVYKVIFAGEPNVGKSSIIQRFVTGRMTKNDPTVGMDFNIKVVRLDEKTAVRVHIFDLAGTDRVTLVSRAYYRRSNGAFFVYDETDLSTLDTIKAWKQEMDKYVFLSNGASIPSILLGNKCDKESEEHKASREKIRKFAKENGMELVMDTSAKEDIGVDEAFRALIDMMINVTRAKRAGELEDSFAIEKRLPNEEARSKYKAEIDAKRQRDSNPIAIESKGKSDTTDGTQTDILLCEDNIISEEKQAVPQSSPTTEVGNKARMETSAKVMEIKRHLNRLREIHHDPYLKEIKKVAFFDDSLLAFPNRYVYKVIFAGEPNVGKTSIIQRFLTGRMTNNDPTVGLDNEVKVVKLDEKTAAKIYIFDLAGTQRNTVEFLSRAYYRRSNGAFFVYDESDLSTLETIKAWKQEMDKYVCLSNGASIPSILLGNKCDIESEEHKKSREIIRKFAKENGMELVMGISAKDDIGVDEAFRALIDMMINVTRAKRSGELEDSFSIVKRLSNEENRSKCAC